jgi:hypothetical protein
MSGASCEPLRRNKLANQIDNRLIVVGLKGNPEDFARELENQMYGRVVPHDSGHFFVEAKNGNFDFTTKWAPKVDAVIELSKKWKDHVFLLSYGGFETQRNGQVVIRNGNVLDSFDRPGYSGLFDEIEYPTLNLFEPYLKPISLAQGAENRLKDAIGIVRRLIEILEDPRFTNSPSRPFSDCRDQAKTERLRLGLAALHESLVEQAKQLDFQGVFLEEQELTERYPAVVEGDKILMKSLGLEPLLPAPGETVRFSMFPIQVALTKDPNRVVSPVLRYTNADPISGKYQKNPDGSIPAIEWEIKYACLTPSEVRQIRRLPDEGQTPFDVDLIMTNAGDRGFGHEIYRASNRAMWTRNPEFRSQVEMEANKVTNAFAAKVAGNPGIAIVDNFEAADATLFPKTNQVALPTADRGIDGAAICK